MTQIPHRGESKRAAGGTAADADSPDNRSAPRPRAVSPARQELEALHVEFSGWMAPRDGRLGAASWSAMRAEARRHAASIADMERLGLDLSERALLALLPYEERADLRRAGAFCHVLPGLTRDPRAWFADAGWTSAEDWPALTRGLFLFVRRCDENPGELWQACHELVALPGSRGIDSALLSPMLNALRPDDFLIVNAATRATLNHFTGSSFGPALSEYPEAQAALRRLIDNSRDVLLSHAPPGMRLGDSFALFSHWLMNERLPAGQPLAAAPAPAALEVAAPVSVAPMVDAPTVAAPVGRAPAERPVRGADMSPEAAIALACAPQDADAKAKAGAEAAAEAEAEVEVIAPFIAPVTAPVTAPADVAPAARDPARDALAHLVELAVQRGQILLCGRPGSGTAAWVEAVARALRHGDGLSERLVFHPGWTRADFLQGADAHGNRRAGRFMEFCRRAAERKGRSVLVIHALQRADADAVFAEALELLDLRDVECALSGSGNLAVPGQLALVAGCETPDGLPPDAPAFTQHFACAAVPGSSPPPQ